MVVSTQTQNSPAPASQPLQQDPEAQLEKPAESSESEFARTEPFINIAIVIFLVALIALPVIFLLGVIFTVTGVMRSDGSIVLDEEEHRPIVNALAGIWLAIWHGADLFAKVLLLVFVVGAFMTYFC